MLTWKWLADDVTRVRTEGIIYCIIYSEGCWVKKTHLKTFFFMKLGLSKSEIGRGGGGGQHTSFLFVSVYRWPLFHLDYLPLPFPFIFSFFLLIIISCFGKKVTVMIFLFKPPPPPPPHLFFFFFLPFPLLKLN